MEEGGEETYFCERGRGALDQVCGKRRLDAGKCWAGEDAAMASSGRSLAVSPSSGGVMKAVAVR